jgi:hypothetical protein
MSEPKSSTLPPGWGRVLANLENREFCAALFDMPISPPLDTSESATVGTVDTSESITSDTFTLSSGSLGSRR